MSEDPSTVPKKEREEESDAVDEDENEDEEEEDDNVSSSGDEGSEKLEDGTSGKKTYACDQCQSVFSHHTGYYNHMKRKHNLLCYSKGSICCREEGCSFRCAMREKLQAHLMHHHNKSLAFSQLKFSSMKDFEEWREVFEKQEKCRFVKKSGTRIRRHTGEKHTYLYCSRSGTFVSNSKGVRTQLKKVTCKISNYCTASIDCVEQLDGTVLAKLCSTHYGHDPSVELLRLTKTDKDIIAGQLGKGVSRDIVLDNIRASVGEDVDRIHLLTMKDIRNIERSYNIKPEIKNREFTCGFASVNEWVREMECLGDESPILFYKPKNQSKIVDEGEHFLGLDDFCVVMMTKGQQDILRKFGQNGVFYITWMSISNGYDLSLLSLMVTDDLNEAFPVAYMVCSTMSRSIEVLFFKVIRDKMGPFCARAIMTDDRKSLFDAWGEVMGFVPYYLLSNRFVDADWRDRLITVPNEDVQCAVYEVLYSYLSVTDSTRFDENLNLFVKHLKENSQTQMFGTYFEDNYLHRVRLWAGCYDKKSVGVNEHLNLDAIYNDLLAVCNSKGKFAKLLEKTLQGLLKIVRDRQYFRTSKITRQAQELHQHHSVSMNIDLDAIQCMENRKWKVKSETSKLIFLVTRKTYECNARCPLICDSCKMCAHMFECTCKVYNFDRTMCKHIHAVGRLFRKNINLMDNLGGINLDNGALENGLNSNSEYESENVARFEDNSESNKTTANADKNSASPIQLKPKVPKPLPLMKTILVSKKNDNKEQSNDTIQVNDASTSASPASEVQTNTESAITPAPSKRTVESSSPDGKMKVRALNLISCIEKRIQSLNDETKLKNVCKELNSLKRFLDSSDAIMDKGKAVEFTIKIVDGDTKKPDRKRKLIKKKGRPKPQASNPPQAQKRQVGRPKKSSSNDSVGDNKDSNTHTVVAEIHEEPKPHSKKDSVSEESQLKRKAPRLDDSLSEDQQSKLAKADEILVDEMSFPNLRRSNRKAKRKLSPEDVVDALKPVVKTRSRNVNFSEKIETASLSSQESSKKTGEVDIVVAEDSSIPAINNDGVKQ
ncbi:hypothetical protein LSTR_LSTR002747 [Laodelphax striatellus]|uniref:SWIM-type domain-containing protein n=1 Tax=Laodelphax striatellus TaxID=195883 RepID=A0A482X5E6_LAOST|nr:hypothetical protein LSTR_LSTR002747 [Laodelphax striatellus]